MLVYSTLLFFILFYFFDDSFIFCNANFADVKEVEHILDKYCTCEMSGQLVNYHKSALCISKGACKKRTNILARILEDKKMECNETYLGNPLVINKQKSTSFEDLVLKINK